MNELYFNWLYDLVGLTETGRSYRRLFSHLYHTDFKFTLAMDMNRAEDGMDLRYRFAYETHTDSRIVAAQIDNKPCSVLEMMAALSLRCEENIMSDPDKGNRIGKWFRVMMTSMGLLDMDDEHYRSQKVTQAINRFLNRRYSANGKGGLFPIKNSPCDLRKVEIWQQMCLYLDDVINETER